MIDSGDAKLRELLNKTFAPQKEFTADNIQFQQPSVEVTDDYNTVLGVKGNMGKGYYGFVTVKYKRVDLAELGTAIELRKEGQLTLPEICDMLNSTSDTFLAESDLLPASIPNLLPGESHTVLLEANPDSIGWTGSVEITIRYGRPFLRAVLGRNTLTAITPPGERYDAPAAWAMLFYQDFTSIRESLRIDPVTNLYTDALAVQSVTSKLGIPNWAVANPRDYPTSAVPDSNQNFDRVVVQNYVGTSAMYGPLYLHYNTTKFDGV